MVAGSRRPEILHEHCTEPFTFEREDPDGRKQWTRAAPGTDGARTAARDSESIKCRYASGGPGLFANMT